MQTHILIENSYDLLCWLKAQNLLIDNGYWWPHSGTFEVVIGAILTQNTKWENVEKSLQHLHLHNLINLSNLASCDIYLLESCIIPSGFYRQKAIRLRNLANNIIADFGDFECFKGNATREWLLEQKGIGMESADSILNYAFYREVMVVDKYTQKLLSSLGFEFYDYNDLQSWLQTGIIQNYDKITQLYGYEIEIAKVYARFHAKIVEYSKTKRFKQCKKH